MGPGRAHGGIPAGVEVDELGAVRIDEGLVRIETDRAVAMRNAAKAEAERPRL